MAADNLHLTLAFLAKSGADKQRAVRRWLDASASPGFIAHLDDAGQWLSRGGVVGTCWSRAAC